MIGPDAALPVMAFALAIACASGLLVGNHAYGWACRVGAVTRPIRAVENPVRVAACLSCAATYPAILLRYGLTLEALELAAFAVVLLLLSLTDMDRMVIPNGCIVAALAIRVAYLLLTVVFAGERFVGGPLALDADVSTLRRVAMGQLWRSVASGVAVLLVLVILAAVAERVLGRASMGGGDLKLFAVAGFYFGWQECLFLVLVACALGVAFAHATGAARSGVDKPFPFGPSIALACVITMLVGSQVVGWYVTVLI